MANLKNLKPFKPGISGNPLGKPRGTLNTATIIKKILQTKAVLEEHPLTHKHDVTLSVQKMLVLAMVKEALHGNVRAFMSLVERAEGKNISPMPINGKETQNIVLRWQDEAV